MCMNVQRTNITLPQDILSQLQASIPQGERSKFIATAISEKLGKGKDVKKAFVESLKANAAFYKNEARQIEEDFKYADAETLEQLP